MQQNLSTSIQLHQGETNICQDIYTPYARSFKHSVNRCMAWNMCTKHSCWGTRRFPSMRPYELCSLSTYRKNDTVTGKKKKKKEHNTKLDLRWKHQETQTFMIDNVPVIFFKKSCNFKKALCFLCKHPCVSTSAQPWVSSKTHLSMHQPGHNHMQT